MRWKIDNQVELRNHTFLVMIRHFCPFKWFEYSKNYIWKVKQVEPEKMRRLGLLQYRLHWKGSKYPLHTAYAKSRFIFWKRTWESFHQKRSETGSSTTTKRVENKETLETRTIVRKFSNSVKDLINNLLANGVMTTSVVVGSILLASDQLFRVKQFTIFSLSNLIKQG